MISSNNTTFRQRMVRDNLCSTMKNEVRKSLWKQELLVILHLIFLCVLFVLSSTALGEINTIDRSLSEPLQVLKRLTWGAEEGQGRLELSATYAEWIDDHQHVILKGNVVLKRIYDQGRVLTLHCEYAKLSLKMDPKNKPQLSSLSLQDKVHLEAENLTLSAQQVHWQEGGALELQGLIKGRWHSHQIEAEKVSVWPNEGRVEVHQARAMIHLGSRRSLLKTVRER